MGKWNGDERREIKLPVTKQQFTAMDMDDKLWMMVEMFCSQVHTCSSRFQIIEKKQSTFKTLALAGMFYLAGLGVVKSDTILSWITGLF